MIKRIFGITALALTFVFATNALAADEIKWETSLEEALKTAAKNKTIVMVDYYTDWCGWCKKLDSDVYTNAEVIKLSKSIVSVKVNAEKEGVESAKKYKVKAFPTIVFLEGNGDVVARIRGYLKAEDFQKEVSKILKEYQEFPELLKKYNKDKENVEVNYKLFTTYVSREKLDKALIHFAQIEKSDPVNEKGYLWKSYLQLGNTYRDLGENTKAIDTFQVIVNKSTDSVMKAKALWEQAITYYFVKNYEGCVKSLDAIIAMKDAPEDILNDAKNNVEAVRKLANEKPADKPNE